MLRFGAAFRMYNASRVVFCSGYNGMSRDSLELISFFQQLSTRKVSAYRIRYPASWQTVKLGECHFLRCDTQLENIVQAVPLFLHSRGWVGGLKLSLLMVYCCSKLDGCMALQFFSSRPAMGHTLYCQCVMIGRLTRRVSDEHHSMPVANSERKETGIRQ